MKRLYIAISFLAIAISLCVFEQYTVNDTYKTTTALIDTAIEDIDSNNIDNAINTCTELEKYWAKKEKYLKSMIDHGTLESASITINGLADLAESESDSLNDQLITAKSQIKSIHDSQKITIGNIF
jgi:hypothetical protein